MLSLEKYLPRRNFYLLFLTLVGGLSMLLLVLSLRPKDQLHSKPGFSEATVWLEKQNGPDLFVVVWPPEQAAALFVLPTNLLASDSVPIEALNSGRYLRVAVIGPKNFSPPPELNGVLRLERQAFSEVEVSVFGYAEKSRILWDLRANLDSIRVSLSNTERLLACDIRRIGGGFSCPGQPEYNHVAPVSITVDKKPWSCIWAHPISAQTLVLDLGILPLGSSFEIEAALSDDAAQTPNGAEVQIQLEVDEILVAKLIRSNHKGIAKTTWITPPRPNAYVKLLINTPSDGRRHLGINFKVLDQTSPQTMP